MKILEIAVIMTLLFGYVWAVVKENDTEENYRSDSCPPWYLRDKERECSFNRRLSQIVHQYGNTSELQVGFCMTVTNTSQIIAQCPYVPISTNNFSQYHSIYQVLPTQLDQVNETMCAQFNRKGYLCSECKDNYGLAASRLYGLMCVKCSSSAWKWIVYILLLFTPQTIFFLLFLILNISVHLGSLTGIINFSQTVVSTTLFFPALISLPQSIFGYWPINILLSLYGAWSLSSMQFLIPPFCLSEHLTTLQLISLGYVASVYPLVLCIITYYLIELHAKGNWLLVKVWRPFRRLFFNIPSSIESSVIHTFGNFIVLSYGKNLFVSFTLVQGSVIYSLNMDTNTLKYLPSRSVDLGAAYFGSVHAPYAALGILGGILTVILPLALVLIYPTRLFPRLISCVGLRRWHAIRTFMEVLVGSFKDGTDASASKIDFRFFAGVYLLSRIVIGCFWTRRGANGPLIQHYAWLITAVPYIVAAVIFAFFKPYRKMLYNVIDTSLFLLMAKLCACFHIIFEMAVSEPTLQVVVLIVLIDLAIPQAVLIIVCCYKIALWAYSFICKSLPNPVRGNRVRSEECNCSDNQITHMETAPLLGQ